MSYQKQKAINAFYEDSKSISPFEQLNGTKRKRIVKQSQKNQSQSEIISSNLPKNKKELAKQIKRIRQQNRRANHKQYVTNLQQQIHKKQVQIQNLSTRIKQLQQELQKKVCNKCGGQIIQLDHCSSFSNYQEVPEIIEKQFELDQQYKRINDDSSLRICFGNKNLLFFFVTMCCLTIGSIADNPQLFLEPIQPFMLKSQLYFLHNNEKLNDFYNYKHKMQSGRKNWQEIYSNKMNLPPELDNSIHKASDIFSFKFLISKLFPSQLNFLLKIKDPTQLVLSFSTNQLLGRILDGRNYYY